MLLFSLLFSAIIYSVLGEGEVLFFRLPPAIRLESDESIDQNVVPEMLSATLGFTTQGDSDWQSITVQDPFSYGEAAVVLVVDGIPSLGSSNNAQRFELNTNEDESMTWKTLRNRITERFPMENNTLFRIELGAGDYGIEDIETKHLDKNVDEDATCLQELADLNQFITKPQKLDGVPDLYWFVLRGLHALTDLRGAHHPATIEAKEKVHQMLLKMAKTYGSMYHGRVTVVALVSDSSHTRRTRSLLQEKGTASNDSTTNYNLASTYTAAYPAIFNIILWFSIAFILSLIAISVFIASMDPGRDSIIYRMTSNRMKKDS